MFAAKGLGLMATVGLAAGAASALAAAPRDETAPADAAARRAVAVRAPAAPDNPYAPPPCTGVFPDVPCPSGFAVNWIERFYYDGITAGCGGGDYCPGNPVTRAEMAVFVEKAMRGTATWSPGDLGNNNTGLGYNALLDNSPSAQFNTAAGSQALQSQSFANGDVPYTSANTAVGAAALFFNQPDGGNGGLNGTKNTAVGYDSLLGNILGYEDTAIGDGAGYSWPSGVGDTFLGAAADAAANALTDATAVGYHAVVDTSYHVRIGDTSVTQIGGQVAWSNLSDVRAKSDVRDLDLGLDFVMSLRPVSFTLTDGNGRTDLGFVAQDVEALLGDGYNVLGIGGDKDRTLSLRYTDFIAPMVKAIQEQQATIEAQGAEIAARGARIAELEKRQAAQQADIEALESAVAALARRAPVVPN